MSNQFKTIICYLKLYGECFVFLNKLIKIKISDSTDFDMIYHCYSTNRILSFKVKLNNVYSILNNSEIIYPLDENASYDVLFISNNYFNNLKDEL